ncbi:hypothetical protein B0H13DRAFT_2385973 [Mycena leptocephala]|nr:hypothetical protein B0H13DRAFT_2385973 [Mycena leptocephala]
MSTKRSRATKPKATLCKPLTSLKPMFQAFLRRRHANIERRRLPIELDSGKQRVQAAERWPVAAAGTLPNDPKQSLRRRRTLRPVPKILDQDLLLPTPSPFRIIAPETGSASRALSWRILSGPAAGTTGSPTPDERIACTALAELAQGPMQFDADKSPTACQKSPHLCRLCSLKGLVLERAMQLTSTEASGVRFPPQFFLEDGPVVLASRTGKLPAGVTPLSRVQELKLHYTGNVGQLTPVQSAQILVAKTNAGTLTRPTLAERMAWHVEPIISWDYLSSEASYISYSQGCAMNAWRLEVCKAVRRAYLAGEELHELHNH